MNAAPLELNAEIPGVFQARQNRSVKARDGFIAAGVAALNEKRLDDLKTDELARASNNPVGSFFIPGSKTRTPVSARCAPVPRRASTVSSIQSSRPKVCVK